MNNSSACRIGMWEGNQLKTVECSLHGSPAAIGKVVMGYDQKEVRNLLYEGDLVLLGDTSWSSIYHHRQLGKSNKETQAMLYNNRENLFRQSRHVKHLYVLESNNVWCEEFHPACYKEYAWGMTDVNLARTLTQDGDDYCDFHVVLREANVPAEKKRQCFPTCDPDYQEPIVDASPAGAKTGFSSLCVRIYYYMLEVLTERFPERAQQVMGDALEYWAEDSVKHLREWSSEMNMPLDKVFAEAHFPMYVNADDEPMWAKYDRYGAKRLMENHFYNKYLSVFA